VTTSNQATAARWRVRELDHETVRAVARTAGLPDLAARLLVARGHTDGLEAQRHLAASPMGLHDPFLLPGMKAATERLARAIRDGETVLVHGDYDVDGVTGTSLLMRMLRLVGAKAVWHIPNRLVDGYSFGEHSIRRAEDTGAKVVISVDNGTSAHDVIAALAERGVDTIVTDHHEASPGPLPVATAIVNPKLLGSTYPWRELCGGAVAFKLAWGLAQELSGATRVTPEQKDFLMDAMAYVAIATVCDVVPLVDENRVFARAGLKALEVTENHGLRAMLEVCGLRGRRLAADDVGFQVGPRINASGRLGSAQRAVDLLLAEDAETARGLAAELDGLNQRRKEIEGEVLAQARVQARDYPDADEHPILVLAGEGWHQGVVGIVAARLVEEFGRPAIVIGLDAGAEGGAGIGRGSARTVGNFNVLDAMRGAAEHMERFGGHAQAAGCEVRPASIDGLRAAVCARAREMLADTDGHPAAELAIDAELAFGDVDRELMAWVDRLEPFGAGNATPIFVSRDVRLAEPPRVVGRDGTHLLLRIRRDSHVLKAMAFRLASRVDELKMGAPLSVAFTPRWNTFRGETNLELVLHDFRVESPTGSPL
jgi:single-stranded-DNA-specific exonuclease